MKRLPIISLLIALVAAVSGASCERDVVPLPTSKEHFTVSSTTRVRFSTGNLQHNPLTGQWRLASDQTQYLTNPLVDEAPDWVDLFPWNPEGWGIPGTDWRVLTSSEWRYLLTFRTNAPKKRGLASVEGICGLVILPDGWQRPAGIPFDADAQGYATNVYSHDQWTRMEEAGAIFLPAAGKSQDGQEGGAGSDGYYWSTSPYDDLGAMNIAFNSQGIGVVYGHNRQHGYSVRLVRED